MCTFKQIAVSNWELFAGSYRTKSQDAYLAHLAQLTAPDAIIVREKHLAEDAYTKLFSALWERCRNAGWETGHADSRGMQAGFFGCCGSTPVLIPHTYVLAARETKSPYLHLPLHLLERYRKEGKLDGIPWIGASVHSPEEAALAERLGASYVTAGHIFATGCKAGLLPRGISFLEKVCQSVSIPVYAIGGIHPSNLGKIQDTKAAGACMMSEYMCRLL